MSDFQLFINTLKRLLVKYSVAVGIEGHDWDRVVTVNGVAFRFDAAGLLLSTFNPATNTEEDCSGLD